MATVKGVYDLIKNRQKKGIKIGILEQAIVEAVEAEQSKTTKEIRYGGFAWSRPRKY